LFLAQELARNIVAGIDDAGIQKAADRYDRNETDFS
jgi:hypothetical protein